MCQGESAKRSSQPPRRRFGDNPIKTLTFELADKWGWPAKFVGQWVDMSEMTDWLGFFAYKAARRDAERETKQMQRENERKPKSRGLGRSRR